MIHVSTRVLAAAIAATACTALPYTTRAGELVASPPSEIVSYGDLNLDSDAGRQELYHRIAVAVDRICPAADNRDLPAMALRDACRRDAIKAAIDQVRRPIVAASLTDLARGRRGLR